MRLQLKPGLQRVSRGPGTVQIGLAPGYGTVLDGLLPMDLALLDQLSGGLDDQQVLPAGAPRPADDDPAGRRRRLIQLLTDAGVLLRTRSGRAALARLGPARARLTADAATWSVVHGDAGDGWELLAARSSRTVEIRGGGRTGLGLAGTLAATGVGAVRMVDDSLASATDVAPGAARGDDVGAPIAEVGRRLVERAAGPGTGPGGDGRPPDLVVLLRRSAADAAAADPLLAADVPHLSVVIGEASVVIGPLVLPGRSPCLRCLDLHRSERDRQWPLVLAQLLSSSAARTAPREETATAQLAAALAALQVLGRLDGRHQPAAVGATLEVELPDGLVSRRTWPAHAACGCSWPPGATREFGPRRTGAASPHR